MLVFAPSTVQEIADLVFHAFDTAEKYRMPALMLLDGMLGQIMEPVVMCEGVKTQEVKKPWALTGHGGKRDKNIINSLYLTPEELEKLVVQRYERYDEIKQNEQMAQEYKTEDADIILVSYGASARISQSAVDMAREIGIKAGLIRPITLWPYPEKFIEKTIDKAKAYLCVEMSMGQMVDDLRLVVAGRKNVEFFGRTGGVIPTPAEVLQKIRLMAGGNK